MSTRASMTTRSWSCNCSLAERLRCDCPLAAVTRREQGLDARDPWPLRLLSTSVLEALGMAVAAELRTRGVGGGRA
jgi:hypothetical protein